MRVLLDECLPKKLRRVLPGHLVFTVAQRGLAGLRNGALLSRMSGEFDAFVTVDGNLKFQQRLDILPFGVVVIRANSNQMRDLEPFVPKLMSALEYLSAGQVILIGKD